MPNLMMMYLQQSQETVVQQTVEVPSNQEIQMAFFLGLLPVVLGFSFIIFVIYRSRRESDFKRKETELRLSKAEGELKALRAQINPHFIFNCLNSIHHFIQSQEPGQASDYLIKFSRLIRYVLESSAKNWVSLAEELEANELYLQLEQLRMQDAFEFEFLSDESLSKENTFIPPMLIQPFLENAVWHGLSNGGRILLKIHKNSDSILTCEISDQGLARVEKPDYDLSNLVKKSSMGINLMEERFSTLREGGKFESGFVFAERLDGGRVVTLKIPFEEE